LIVPKNIFLHLPLVDAPSIQCVTVARPHIETHFSVH
jgi:hypothetical protein